MMHFFILLKLIFTTQSFQIREFIANLIYIRKSIDLFKYSPLFEKDPEDFANEYNIILLKNFTKLNFIHEPMENFYVNLDGTYDDFLIKIIDLIKFLTDRLKK